jgi:hypothetical protein
MDERYLKDRRQTAWQSERNRQACCGVNRLNAGLLPAVTKRHRHTDCGELVFGFRSIRIILGITVNSGNGLDVNSSRTAVTTH